MVRAVVDVVCEPQEDQHGLGWSAGERNLFFCANYGRIAGRYHEWVKDTLKLTVAMFCRLVIETNLNNTKAMFCMPSFIWVKWGEQDYKRREMGEGATFRESNRMQVSCTKCGMPLESSYLKHHMEHLHGICVTYTIGFL